MKTIKTVKTISAIKTIKKNAMFSPLRQAPPQKLPQYHSPFLTEMAKGLRLVSEAIKLGCQQCDLVLDSCKVVGVLSLYISKTINPFNYDLKGIEWN